MGALYKEDLVVENCGFVLKELREVLLKVGLYTTVKAVQYGTPQSNFHFFAILECYNPMTCTFFNPCREMGFALHEMYKVPGLSMGHLPYEEYIPSTEELHLMKKDVLLMYETY